MVKAEAAHLVIQINVDRPVEAVAIMVEEHQAMPEQVEVQDILVELQKV